MAYLKAMKTIIILIAVNLGLCFSVSSQEIIPFPDLSENHIAVYNQAEVIDDHNYSMYTKEYEMALKEIDLEIQAVGDKIETESEKSVRKALESDRDKLVKKRLKLLQEAELLEDLYKFY